MVLRRIEIREGNVRSDRDDRQEGMELQILLGDDVSAIGMSWPGGIARGIKGNHGIADRSAGDIDDTNAQTGR